MRLASSPVPWVGRASWGGHAFEVGAGEMVAWAVTESVRRWWPRRRLSRVAAVVGLSAFFGGAAFWAGQTQGGVLAGVASVAAAGAALLVDRRIQAADRLGQARHARGEVLRSLRPPPLSQETDGVLALLEATRSPTRFWSRKPEQEQIQRWLAQPEGHPVLIVGGPAGIGKTRLALQCAEQLAEGWAAGWLAPDTGAHALQMVKACPDRTLVLVDDADLRPDAAAFLESLAEHNESPVVRTILLARNVEGLRAALSTALTDRSRWVGQDGPALLLPALGEASDYRRWFEQAVRSFAAARQVPVPELETTGQGWEDPHLSPLELQMRALSAVLTPGRAGAGGPIRDGRRSPRWHAC